MKGGAIKIIFALLKPKKVNEVVRLLILMSKFTKKKYFQPRGGGVGSFKCREWKYQFNHIDRVSPW